MSMRAALSSVKPKRVARLDTLPQTDVHRPTAHRGRNIVQQTAVSETVDFRLDTLPLDTIPREKREKRDRSRVVWRGNTAIDVGWALAAVPYADIAVPLAPHFDVMPRERSELLSRILNVAVAAVGLILTLPVIALIAIAIKLTSPGPVLYSQTRVGLDRRHRRASASDQRRHDYGGKLFKMYKLRTMRADAEADGRAVWAEPSDPRVTAVGRFLRRARLDELPQLYNVIRGDMNIVGPRPERPCIFARLRDDIPNYQLRQRVKPGITGWAQINQSYDVCLDDVRCKVRHDLEYLRRQGLAEDLRIMAMTLPVLLLRRGGW
jgi:lipopolysaccharide/colanic/teichoic acid biosynthesis glycosyltransferase